jgi:uncharacterized lipoprotein YmbA
MNEKRIGIIGIICLIGVGCSPLAPQQDYSKFFILSPLPAAAPGKMTASTSPKPDPTLTLGIGPIDFPDYLRRPEVVTLTSPNQIRLSQERRWGEALDKNFSRVLAEDLSRLLDTQRIEKYPWSHKSQVDYQIVIDVQHFETSSDGESQLVARWIIKEGSTGKDLFASETTATTSVASGDTGASLALSKDLATLSADIAARVRELSQHDGTRASQIIDPENG